jgi:hypothetical protein
MAPPFYTNAEGFGVTLSANSDGSHLVRGAVNPYVLRWQGVEQLEPISS